MTYEEKLSQMIQCETVSKLGQTDLSRFYAMHKKLKELFPNIFAAAEYEDHDGSLLLIWKGKNPSLKPVMLMDHMDVVEPNGQWQYPPFSGTIADGKVWGRGTQDTKDGLFFILQAADELAAEGYVPSRDIYFESTCNEEISGEGATKLSREFQEKGIEFDFILDEGGKIPEGEGIANIGVSEKSIVELEFVAKAEGGHASRPPKNSALVKLGRFLAAADDEDNLFSSAFVKETGETEKTTLAFTMAEGSKARNVIPTSASAIASMRCSAHQGTTGSIEAVKKFAEKYDIEVNVLFKGVDAVISGCELYEDGNPAKLSGYGKIIKALDEVYPGVKPKPFIMLGGTDSVYYTPVCSNIYRFSPVIVNKAQLDSIHGLNENITTANIYKAVEYMKTLIQFV